jgi:hypothetical protein
VEQKKKETYHNRGRWGNSALSEFPHLPLNVHNVWKERLVTEFRNCHIYISQGRPTEGWKEKFQYLQLEQSKIFIRDDDDNYIDTESNFCRILTMAC